MKKILIVGANGKIGKSLFSSLTQIGYHVTGSSHRATKGMIPFNLCSQNSFPEEFENITHAIICGATTNIRKCEENPQMAYQCNVLGTIALVEAFLRQGTQPILFSSDYVFDGEKGDYLETDPLHPLNEYGRQKAELDQRLLQTNCVIFRLSKVIGINTGENDLIDEIVQKIQRKDRIFAATDQIFSPLYLQDLLDAIHKVIEGSYCGLYHLCGPETRSRCEIAFLIARNMGAPLESITPISLKDLKEPFLRPKNTSMKADRWMRDSGVTLTPLSLYLNKLLATYSLNPN